MNTTQTPSITNSSPESDGSGAASPQRSYAELERRYQLLLGLCEQLLKRVSELERLASTQNESQQQTLELLAKCLAALKNSVTRQEWEILCARLNTVSSLLPPIADALGVPSKDSG